ncbi:MAG: hypothetical protein ACLR6O_03455 [Eubacterium sp.]
MADTDLKLRGPGDFFGSRQHGLPELKIADMVEDMGTSKSAGMCTGYFEIRLFTLQLPALKSK